MMRRDMLGERTWQRRVRGRLEEVLASLGRVTWRFGRSGYIECGEGEGTERIGEGECSVVG